MKIPHICSISGCGKKHAGRGFCRTHYTRWKRHGDPNAVLCDHATDPESLKRKFDEKWAVSPNGCWRWIGSINQINEGGSKARGFMRISGRIKTAHRMAWILYRGTIPKGVNVLHTCDDSICVNPDHLYLGTLANNMEDMVKRRRNPVIKLTPENVAFIKSSDLKLRELAAMFGVSETSVCAARKGRTFKFL